MSVDPLAATALSVEVATASTLLSLLPAVGVGHLLSRLRGLSRAVLSGVVLIPLVLPPVVTGLLLLDLLGVEGPIGSLLQPMGVRFTFSLLGAIVAAAVVGFPLYVVAVRQALEAVDPRYLEVAATLGDPPARAFARVTLPLAAPGIAAGAVLAFARALGEFGATVVLAGNMEGRTRTIALAVYTLLDSPGSSPQLPWLLGASLGLAVATLVAYEALVSWHRHRLERGRA